MRSQENIESDILKILSLIFDHGCEFEVTCSIDEDGTGIPGAIIDALDRFDPTGLKSEALHMLILEFANVISTRSRIDRCYVSLVFRMGQFTIRKL